MTEERYDPPSEKVDALIAKYSARELAVAYLRSARRAKALDAAFRSMDQIAHATDAAHKGDADGLIRSLEETHRILAAHNEHLNT